LNANPSAWRERRPLVALAVLGLAISTYLALYQVGIVAAPWDPIFGSASSAQVLDSTVSRALPVPDATLGMLGYLGEVVLGAVGDEERWHTQPWLVALYGLLVLGMGLASFGLLFVQAFLVHAWCLLCLLSAAISFTLLALASREALATLRYLESEREGGGPAQPPPR